MPAEFTFPLLAAGVTCVFSSNVVFIFQEIRKKQFLYMFVPFQEVKVYAWACNVETCNTLLQLEPGWN